MKLGICENQRGFLFKNGKFQGLLGPGRYFVWRKLSEKPAIYSAPFGKTIEVVSCHGDLGSTLCDRATLLKAESVQAEVSQLRVERGEAVFHFVDGIFCGSYLAGMYAFWNVNGENSFLRADITTPYVAEDFPRELFSCISKNLYAEEVVDERMYGLLFIDGKFQKVLPAGRHFFWRNGREISVRCVSAHLEEEVLVGQEILTADKVSLRIGCVCEYTVIDPVRAVTEVGNYAESLHTAAQISLRAYIGRRTLDEILADRDGVSAFLLEKLREKAPELFLDVRSAAVRDIILPGEIREIMNTVLVAEKRAQANLIARREEVASTRSLLNTAKLMEENKTLYKLKELEYLERIFEHVNSLELGGGDVLAQLRGALGD